MSDKPVAWTDGNGHYFDKNSFFPVDDLMPLYIHPAKTLTDEEIIEEIKLLPQLISMEDKDFIGFARAILKKAKEK